MSQKKYVSLSKLSTFLDNLYNKFASLGHKHTLNDITNYTVDEELSSTSTNPVQNKVIDAEFEAISTAMNALESAIDGNKPDWTQNNPDAPDYVKNRTHWIEDAKLETIFDGTLDTSGVGSAHFDFLEMTKPLVVGEEYLVTLNDTQYWLTAGFDGDFVYVGDNTYKYTTIPFVLYNDSDTSQMFETNKSGTWKLNVKHNSKVVHQLDEKFIPDTIARAHNWTKIYDSGAITKNVNAFSSISLDDYTNIMVAIKVVNTTSSAGNTGGAITFIGEHTGTSYAFRNILPDLIKNTSGTTGGMAIFKIIDGFIICENAMRSTNAENMLSATDGAGTDNLVPVGGGVVACTDKIAYFYVGNTNSSKTHYYGTGSRVVVWGCKS